MSEEYVDVQIDLWDGGQLPGNWIHWRLSEIAKAEGKTLKTLILECIEDGLSEAEKE